LDDGQRVALDFTTLDVFTQTRFSGNQLAVVWDADALTTQQMQAVASEFGYSETTFVLRPKDPKFDALVRIFTPSFELPFAGHPTIGTAIALAERLSIDSNGSVTFELAAGPVSVDLERKAGGLRAEFAPPVLPHILRQQEVDLAPILGIKELKKLYCASAGTPFAFLELADQQRVDACSIGPGFEALMSALGVVGLFFYARQDDTTLFARMFAPEAGVSEDPATGSAVAALAAILWAQRPASGPYVIHQGVKMGRASKIGLSLAPDSHGKLGTALISGHAIEVMTGRLTL
jgi:trans-2,3-dihydro-3-hydroxyanthranilate isomerase